MIVVRAALGSNLNLSAGETSILSIVAIGDDFYALHGIFRRCDDRGSAPDSAGGADAVKRNAIVLGLLPVADDLRTVFGLENAVRTTGLPSACLRAGEVIVVAAARLRAIREGSGSQLDELEDIAPERRHVLDLVGGNRSADGGCFRVDERRGIAIHRNTFRDLRQLQAEDSRRSLGPR